MQNPKQDRKNSTRETFKIAIWCYKFVYSLDPKLISLYTFLVTIDAFHTLINSYILAKIIDSLIKLATQPGANIQMLAPYLVALLSFNLFHNIILTSRRIVRNRINKFVELKRELAFQRQIHSLGISALEDPQINDNIHKARTYGRNIFMIMDHIINIATNLVTLIVSMVIVSKFAIFVIPLIIGIYIPYLIVDARFRREIYTHYDENTENRRKHSSIFSVLASPHMLKEVNVLGAFRYLDQKFEKFFTSYEKVSIAILEKFNLKHLVHRFVVEGVLFTATVKLFQDFIKGAITIGDLTFQRSALTSMSGNTSHIISLINDINESAYQFKDSYQLFHAKPVIKDGTIELPRLDKGPEISINNLTFNYPNSEKTIFKNFNLNIKPGEKVAIVGENGAGKTTLVKLISKIYVPQQGEILINGQNINAIKTDTLFKNYGILHQEFNKYSELTVKENITIGDSDQPIDEIAVRLAAQSADAIKFIEELPNKFDTTLDEKLKGGVRLSTGQWQKLAIARFFYRNSPLIIFDEPTAAIDAVSEYNIFNKIYDFFEGKTVIIISHRFSTVRNADRIIVVDKGQILEEGTHQHLMELNGVYAKSFLLQAEGYQTTKSKNSG